MLHLKGIRRLFQDWLGLHFNWQWLDSPNETSMMWGMRRLNNSTVLIHSFRKIESRQNGSNGKPNSRKGYVIAGAYSTFPLISSTTSENMGAVHPTFGQIQKPTGRDRGYLDQAVRPSWIFQVWKWTGRDIRLRYEASPLSIITMKQPT